jgi:hypothetical protein
MLRATKSTGPPGGKATTKRVMFDCAATGKLNVKAVSNTVKAAPIARRLNVAGRIKVGFNVVMDISSFL